MAIFTKRGTEITQEFIAQQMEKSDAWLYHSITAIYKWQTEDEKAIQATSHSNGVGFNAIDAHILSSFAKQIASRNFLTPKQKAIARKKMTKYTGQLLNIARSKIKEYVSI